jgi:hypothetical protein
MDKPKIRFSPHVFAEHRVVLPHRPLDGRERALLLFLLSQPFPGRETYLEQAESVLVCGECGCGCTTIDLAVPGRSEGWESTSRLIVADAYNYGGSHTPVEVLLHTSGGVLREIEVVWYAGEGELRPVERVAPEELTLR